MWIENFLITHNHAKMMHTILFGCTRILSQGTIIPHHIEFHCPDKYYILNQPCYKFSQVSFWGNFAKDFLVYILCRCFYHKSMQLRCFNSFCFQKMIVVSFYVDFIPTLSSHFILSCFIIILDMYYNLNKLY